MPDGLNGNDPAPIATLEAPTTTGNPAGSTGGQGAATPAPERDAAADTKAQYHEALDRLSKGEKPQAINATLGSKPQQGGKASTPAPATAKPADGTPQPATPASEAEGDHSRGLSTQELNALKRGHINVDDAHWKSVPVSNLKAIAKNMAASQAEADRQFQAAKQGKGPAAANGQAAPADGQAQQQQGKAGEPAAGEAGGQAQSDPAPQEPGNRDLKSTADFFQPLPPLPAATRQTLVDLGGEELATQVEAANTHAFQHISQQFAPLVNAVNQMAGMLESRDINDGLADLRKEPGMSQLTDDQTKAIREKATHLMRASSAPITDYSMRDAVKEAARVVLNLNVQQNAQAQLLDRRQASIHGSPDKGTSRTATPGVKLSSVELTREVAKRMGHGKSAKEARAELEAEGLV